MLDLSDAWRGTWLRGGKGILAGAAAAYLVLLPLGTFPVVPMAGARLTGADLLLGILVVLGLVTLARSPGFRATALRRVAGGWRALRLSGSRGPADDLAASLLLLAAFAVWAGSSAAWGLHPYYAAAKGAGYLALVVGVAVIVWSGLEWNRALAAWLLGALLTVGLSLGAAAVAVLAAGAEGWTWAGRVLYQGDPFLGLPGRRLRGSFLHPNGLGDYLVVSGALLWAWWPAASSRGSRRSGGPLRGAGMLRAPPGWLLHVGALLLGVALLLTLSSAWIAAGALLVLWGRRLASRPGRGPSSLASPLLRAGGAIMAATTLAGLVFPVRIGWGDLQVVTSGIRVRIWEDALQAFLSSPVTGVGAAPGLADAADLAGPAGGSGLWDAHNTYLSVLAQFGLVGFVLAGAAALFLIRAVLRARGTTSPPVRARARTGVLAALIAVAVHGLVIAGEDFRHGWLLVAVTGLVVGATDQGEGFGRRVREKGPGEGSG